jgi:hypothetical protein
MTPSELEELARKLTPMQREALSKYTRGVWYGRNKPHGAAGCKGAMVRAGLVEHDGGVPETKYRLTRLGLALRAHLQDTSNG